MALILVKVGGELLGKAALADSLAWAQDLAALCARGERIILVHGGGPQANTLGTALGHPPRIIAGRRVTDEKALEVVQMAVGGLANIDLCGLLVRAGLKPVGLHGASGPVLRAVRRKPRPILGGPKGPVDLGHVGDVTGFDLPLLDRLLDGGYVPVLACLGCGAQGEILNINADLVASELAVATRASLLLLLTGAPGVLADPDDPASRIPRLCRGEAHAAVAAGTVRGGMLAKLEESFAALERGVGQVIVVGKLRKGELLRAMEQPGSIGTVLVR